MKFKVKDCDIIIDYTFVLVLSFAALFSASQVIYMLIYCALHELSHLAALIIVGGKADMLKFSFYGLALRYTSKLSKKCEIIVLVSGPLANLILYLIFYDELNLILFFLNILPIYPLDGGRILELFSYRASKVASVILIAILAAASLYFIVLYRSFSLFLITVYLIFYSANYF